MNRGQMQYKMRGQMLRAARRSAMRGHVHSRSASSSDDVNLGGIVVLISIVAMLFIVVYLLGVWAWAILFFVGVPVMAGWLVHLVQISGTPPEAATRQPIENIVNPPPIVTNAASPAKAAPSAYPLSSQAVNTTLPLRPRSHQSYIYRARSQYVRGHSRITKDGRIVQVKGHMRSHK